MNGTRLLAFIEWLPVPEEDHTAPGGGQETRAEKNETRPTDTLKGTGEFTCKKFFTRRNTSVSKVKNKRLQIPARALNFCSPTPRFTKDNGRSFDIFTTVNILIVA